jgi:hypothetical protein
LHANAALLNLQQISSENSPSGCNRHRARIGQAGLRTVGYHENAANLARPARPRRGMSMGVAQPVPLPNRPGYRTRANHDGNNFVPAVLEPQMTGSSALCAGFPLWKTYGAVILVS